MAASTKSDISVRDDAVLYQIFSPNLVYSECDEHTDLTTYIEPPPSKEVIEAKNLELDGVKAAEAGKIDEALDYFDKAASVAPQWASVYNNRAQAYRLKGKNEEALQDLSTAIQLSNGHGPAAKQAYTQRALLRKLAGNDEDALEDFRKASNLGNEFAKQQVIAANPYAAMCNAMLNEVVHKIQRGEQSVN